MSFNEAEIEFLTKLVHKEVKRILDTGLMYTEEADKQAPKSQPPKTETPKIKEAILSPKLDALLSYERNPEGILWAKVKNHLSEKEFAEVANEIQEICGAKYVKGKGWELP
jgi:hypothetical protein